MKALVMSAVLAGSLTGCASLVNGVNEPVSVETLPKEGATCSLENDKGKWFINKTPGTVTVHRSYQDLDVKCQEEGCKPTEEKVKSKTKAMAAGNILFGGIVGAGVDTVDGAAYDYPSDIKVGMDGQSATAPMAQVAPATSSAKA